MERFLSLLGWAVYIFIIVVIINLLDTSLEKQNKIYEKARLYDEQQD